MRHAICACATQKPAVLIGMGGGAMRCGGLSFRQAGYEPAPGRGPAPHP